MSDDYISFFESTQSNNAKGADRTFKEDYAVNPRLRGLSSLKTNTSNAKFLNTSNLRQKNLQ